MASFLQLCILLQAGYAPAHSSQSAILRVNAARSRHRAYTTCCPGSQGWFRCFPLLSMLREPGRASKNRQMFFAAPLLYCVIFHCAEGTARGVPSASLSPRSLSLQRGILGRSRRTVRLNLSILLQATIHQQPQFSRLLLYHATLSSQAKRVVCENPHMSTPRSSPVPSKRVLALVHSMLSVHRCISSRMLVIVPPVHSHHSPAVISIYQVRVGSSPSPQV